MRFSDLYQTLQAKDYCVFSYEDILSFYPKEKRANLKQLIYQWSKKGLLQPLKRGLYELTYPKDLTIPDLYIANKLYQPSYVSLETALSNYSILPEVSMAVTSVTSKPTRRFKNKHGLFLYRTIQPTCFTGYYVEQNRGFSLLIAEPEKALVDYIYFKTYRTRRFSYEDERFDKDILLRLNKKKMKRYAALYGINLRAWYAHL